MHVPVDNRQMVKHQNKSALIGIRNDVIQPACFYEQFSDLERISAANTSMACLVRIKKQLLSSQPCIRSSLTAFQSDLVLLLDSRANLFPFLPPYER
jgi:hypothetical protein